MQYDRIADGLFYFTIQGPRVETDILKPAIISRIFSQYFHPAFSLSILQRYQPSANEINTNDIDLNSLDKSTRCYDKKFCRRSKRL